jgi:hypothetical protein
VGRRGRDLHTFSEILERDRLDDVGVHAKIVGAEQIVLLAREEVGMRRRDGGMLYIRPVTV